MPKSKKSRRIPTHIHGSDTDIVYKEDEQFKYYRHPTSGQKYKVAKAKRKLSFMNRWF